MQQFLPAPWIGAFMQLVMAQYRFHPIEPDWTLDDTSAYNSVLSGEHSMAESSRGAAFGGFISFANYRNHAKQFHNYVLLSNCFIIAQHTFWRNLQLNIYLSIYIFPNHFCLK
ncbi:hypothetical protein CEXT_543881 [Caerostris extrusa]|uniref:Uncharacterized protein n=1 Tax=Caerostris extrusa TaxID=172846 RepID=A0AAV4Y3U2_CAEEX|nr:hypothetical protein CEXT_543881 [Caerostris extrusa]